MDERSVSTVVSYVLALGILAILISMLFVSVAPFAENQQHTAVHSALTVLSQDVAGDIESADRLARNGDGNTTVQVRTRLPEWVGGSTYEIEIVQQNERVLDNGMTVYETDVVVRSNDPDISATATVRTRTEVAERRGSTALDGGSLVITVDDDPDEPLVVDDE